MRILLLLALIYLFVGLAAQLWVGSMSNLTWEERFELVWKWPRLLW